MAIHSCIPAWKIPWTEDLGGLQSMGSQRVRHNERLSISTTSQGNRVWTDYEPGQEDGGEGVGLWSTDSLSFPIQPLFSLDSVSFLLALSPTFMKKKIKNNLHTVKFIHFSTQFWYLANTYSCTMTNRWGKSGNSGRFYILGLQNHCGQWLQPWN